MSSRCSQTSHRFMGWHGLVMQNFLCLIFILSLYIDGRVRPNHWEECYNFTKMLFVMNRTVLEHNKIWQNWSGGVVWRCIWIHFQEFSQLLPLLFSHAAASYVKFSCPHLYASIKCIHFFHIGTWSIQFLSCKFLVFCFKNIKFENKI